MGDPNASIPTPQPVYSRPMFGAFGRALDRSSVLFVSAAAQADGIGASLGLAKETLAVSGTRTITKRDMVHNNATPIVEVHPETYEVRADGELLTCEPASELPLAQRYFFSEGMTMTDLPVAHHLLCTPPVTYADTVVLDYDARLMRRKRLVGRNGLEFLADLSEVTNLDDHCGFLLEDGRAIGVQPAPEELIEVRGDLPRLAWHIGNRHTPCQMAADHLRIRRDHVIETMLARLGARFCPVTGPFRPEGGAYGKGRTMGHDHGLHDHGHSHPVT